MDSVVGIDLSGVSRGAKGQTALAQISIDPRARLLDTRLFDRGERNADATLIEWVTERRPSVVAIDAPLSLPHRVTCLLAPCQRCDAPDASYLHREVDEKVGGMSTVMLAAIAFRGTWLAKVLRRNGLRVVETYPAQVLAGFGLTTKRERRDPALVDGVLEGRIAGYRANSMDVRHAICAALVARDVTLGQVREEVGSDGSIWLTRQAHDRLAGGA
jgi:predicted nuclease with RNAse H fold